MESARNTASLGPAMAPLSRYHLWNNNSVQLLAIEETTLCHTSENSSGPSGSPCWTPVSEEIIPYGCQRTGCCPSDSTTVPMEELQGNEQHTCPRRFVERFKD